MTNFPRRGIPSRDVLVAMGSKIAEQAVFGCIMKLCNYLTLVQPHVFSSPGRMDFGRNPICKRETVRGNVV